MQNLQSAFGVFALLAIAWIVSEDRRGVAWRQVAVALLVTFATAVILLKVPVMTGGMAGIAGTVLVIYATLLGPIVPGAAAHFVIASVMGAPAAILISLVMVPERGGTQRTGGETVEVAKVALSTMDAIVRGTA